MKIEQVMRWTVAGQVFESKEAAQYYVRLRSEAAVTDWLYNNTSITRSAAEDAARAVVAQWPEVKAIVEGE